jgi:ferredoxin-NADP reductase
MGAREARLIAARPLSPSVKSLTFRTEDGRPVGHVSGQYFDFTIRTASGAMSKRAYSVASRPDPASPSTFEIAVTRVPGGATSEAMHALSLGDVVSIDGPRGKFVLDRQRGDEAAIFIATGTGLSPIRAMLAEELLGSSHQRLVLLFGCRTPADILWADELRAWEWISPRFRMHVSLSRAPEDWDGLTGYVQNHIRSVVGPLGNAQAYICGLTAMVDEVTERLTGEDGGLPWESLHYEIYD